MHSTKTLWALGAIVVVCIIAVVLLAPSIMEQPPTGPSTPSATSTQAEATSTPTKAAPAPHYTAPTKSAETKSTTATTSTATVSGVGPLSYLLQSKEPLVCSIKSTSSYTKRSGTAYFAQGKLHADFSSYINGVLTHTFMIDDGAHLYAWKSGAAKGLKLLAASSVSGSAIAAAGGIDLATPVYYACNPWTEDPSIFVAPSSVIFSNSL